MPKFKDLGINTIPVTMRPPAIGDGGGGGKKPEDDNTAPCDPETCVGDEEDEEEDNTEPCDPETCVTGGEEEEDNTEPCDPETCVTGKDKDKDKKTLGFSPEVANQLRQQLDLEINT